MKRVITIVFCCVSLSAFSQGSKKTFIITSSANSPAAYNHISAVDVNGSKPLEDIYDTNKKYAYRNNGFRSYELRNGDQDLRLPMGNAVACMAYDAKNSRLYYIPQQLSELRYLDLKQSQPSFTYFESQSLNLLHNREDVANQITRMTIGADGFGYALSNDGEHLIKFSTQETPVIQDLGVLVDNPKNQVMVRSSCTSWGGDIVGAADGSLYLVTVHNHVFRISLPGKQADYVGQIKNLPAEFTSNGASADEDGNLVVSCGASLGKKFSPLYKVNWATLEATPVATGIAALGNISDMASSNLLFQRSSGVKVNEVSFNQSLAETSDNTLPAVSIFPNPVVHGRFQVRTSNLDKGEYKMLVLDGAGKSLTEGKLSVKNKTTTNWFNFPSQQAKGVYFIQLSDAFNRTVFSQQLIVE